MSGGQTEVTRADGDFSSLTPFLTSERSAHSTRGYYQFGIAGIGSLPASVWRVICFYVWN